jgi:hypothetical protein
MGILGGSAAGPRRERRMESASDLRTGGCGDCQMDLPVNSSRDLLVELQSELRRDLGDDLQRGFRSGFEGELRVGKLGTVGLLKKS